MPSFMDVLSSEELPAVDSSTDTDTTDQTDDTAVDDDVDTSTNDASTDDTDAGDDGDDDSGASDDADSADAVHATADGTKLPKELASIVKQHPEAAKQIKDLYFTNQSLLKYGKPGEIRKMKEAIDAFGSPDEVVKLKQTLDLVGGEQGIQELQSDLEKWNGLEHNYMNDAPQFVDTLIDASPEAFEAMMPTAIMRFGTASPDLYNNMMSQVIMNTFINDGTINSLRLMKQALAAGNTDLVSQELETVVGNIANISTLAKQAPAQKQVDPAKQAFEQERQTFQQKQDEMFIKNVTDTNEQWTVSTVKKELTSYLKGTKLTDSMFNRMYNAIRDEVIGNLSKNQGLVKQWEALKSRKDRDGMLRFTKQHAGKLLPETTRKIAREFGLNPGNAKKTTPAKSATAKNDEWIPVKTLPYDDIDKEKTKAYAKSQGKTYEDLVWRGMVITKDGKKLKLTKLN